MREAAARNRIEIAGIHWVLVKPEGLYINHPDRTLRERTAKYFCDLVDFCADLGGKVMVVGSPEAAQCAPRRFARTGPGLGGGDLSGTRSRKRNNGK